MFILHGKSIHVAINCENPNIRHVFSNFKGRMIRLSGCFRNQSTFCHTLKIPEQYVLDCTDGSSGCVWTDRSEVLKGVRILRSKVTKDMNYRIYCRVFFSYKKIESKRPVFIGEIERLISDRDKTGNTHREKKTSETPFR